MSKSIPNVGFLQADLMKPIPAELQRCCDSLSCLHTIEHFGLGRYGDPINDEGYRLGLNNLYEIVEEGGMLYLSVPIGPQRIEFDAHRIFSVEYLLELFQEKWTVERFSYIDDHRVLHDDISITTDSVGGNFGCHSGCGIFELRKATSS